MKYIKIRLAVLVFSLLSLNVVSQTIDEIVTKHIEAIGGKENWEKIKSLRIESMMKAQGAEIRFTVIQVDKKAVRSDISVMGMVGFNIVSTTEGWNYMPWQGHTKSEAMTADDVKNAQDELSIKDEFLTYKELGKKIDYYGMDDIDGTECFKIKMTDKDGKETTFYIDPANYLVIKKTEKMKANGQESESSTFYSDYKKLDEGITFPMSKSNGWNETEITKLEINPTVNESIFKPSK
jgi:hypothetical protein